MIYHKGLPFEDEIIISESQFNFERIHYKNIIDDKYKDCSNASHCLIYFRSNYPVLKVYNSRAMILMQVRFDGHLGFPGGLVDPGESAEEALNRELLEELNMPSSLEIDVEDRKFIHYNKDKHLLLHFFTKQVTPELFREIELKATKAPEFGNEVLGWLRVPLYTMCDGYRGFPAFLQNRFIGNSKQQLIESVQELNILSEEEINKALKAKPSWSKPAQKTFQNITR